VARLPRLDDRLHLRLGFVRRRAAVVAKRPAGDAALDTLSRLRSAPSCRCGPRWGRGAQLHSAPSYRCGSPSPYGVPPVSASFGAELPLCPSRDALAGRGIQCLGLFGAELPLWLGDLLPSRLLRRRAAVVARRHVGARGDPETVSACGGAELPLWPSQVRHPDGRGSCSLGFFGAELPLGFTVIPMDPSCRRVSAFGRRRAAAVARF
jgi:hypothetical protein